MKINFVIKICELRIILFIRHNHRNKHAFEDSFHNTLINALQKILYVTRRPLSLNSLSIFFRIARECIPLMCVQNVYRYKVCHFYGLYL